MAAWLGLPSGAVAAAPPPPSVPRPFAASRPVPPLDACVALERGAYRLGEPGEERMVALEPALVGRWPVTIAHVRRFARASGRRLAPQLRARLGDPELQDHPAVLVTRDDAKAFCVWASATLRRRVRLPTGAEWEAVARGVDGRRWPWGETFDPERCACVEAGWGWTVPVTAHPAGAAASGAEQLAGNVWEWVADVREDGWAVVRGGSYLDHDWGVRASRALAADPGRATATTGFRIAIDPTTEERRTA